MKRIIQVILILVLSSTCALADAAPKKSGPSFKAKGAFMAFFVPDLEASVRWYSEKLGLEVVERPPASDVAKVAILEGGGLIVELIEHSAATSRKKPDDGNWMQHGVFKAGVIVDDFEALTALLKKREVDIAFGPFPARGKQRANLIVRDNSGNMIQFFGK